MCSPRHVITTLKRNYVFSGTKLYFMFVLSLPASVRPSVRLWLKDCPYNSSSLNGSIVIRFETYPKWVGEMYVRLYFKVIRQKSMSQGSKNHQFSPILAFLDRFGMITPVVIVMLLWNFAVALMVLRKGSLLISKVVGQISRSRRLKKWRFFIKFPRFGPFSDDISSLNIHMTIAVTLYKALYWRKIIWQISRSNRLTKWRYFLPN